MTIAIQFGYVVWCKFDISSGISISIYLQMIDYGEKLVHMGSARVVCSSLEYHNEQWMGQRTMNEKDFFVYS